MIVKSDDVIKQIFDGLGIDISPDRAYRLIIDLKVNEPLRVYILGYGTEEALSLNWNEVIEKAVVLDLRGSDDEDE